MSIDKQELKKILRKYVVLAQIEEDLYLRKVIPWSTIVDVLNSLK